MKQFVLGFGLLCIAATSHADVYGLVNGRTADIRSEPQTTFEVGLSLEDDLTTFGGQLNFKVAPDMLIYGTLANVDADSGDDDIAFGGGVVYQFDQNTSAAFNAAIKVSYHLLDLGSGAISTDLSDFGLDLIVSPKQQSIAQGFKVFAMIGYHRLEADSSTMGFSSSNTDSELSLGVGATVRAGVGEAYAALEIVDDLFVGLGYRLALGQR